VSPVDLRQGRYAENEAAFRRVNERIREYKERYDRAEPMRFVCECADGGCIQPVHISMDEYVAVRARPRRFIVAPGHDEPDLERVVERFDRYWVVEKYADTAPATS
jgi:hypothetical protein